LQIRDQDFMEAAGRAARDGTGHEIQCASNWTEQAQANTSEGESTNPTDPTEGTKNEGELAYANACGPLKGPVGGTGLEPVTSSVSSWRSSHLS
jgi:hypothetical protein